MFTTTQIVLSALLLLCLGPLSVIAHCLWKHPKKRKGKFSKLLKLNKTRSGRDLEIGNQAGRDVIIKERSKPCQRELMLFAQCKDLQNTVNQVLQQLDVKNRVIFNLQDQVRDEKVLQERLYSHINTLNSKLLSVQEENDALWDENNRLKYEQLSNRIPLLDLNKVFETKVA